jgi:hypothetical protein
MPHTAPRPSTRLLYWACVCIKTVLARIVLASGPSRVRPLWSSRATRPAVVVTRPLSSVPGAGEGGREAAGGADRGRQGAGGGVREDQAVPRPAGAAPPWSLYVFVCPFICVAGAAPPRSIHVFVSLFICVAGAVPPWSLHFFICLFICLYVSIYMCSRCSAALAFVCPSALVLMCVLIWS